MNYGRIRRGPMAADAFTQIRNAVFRDPRLSAKAMGIFGNISTHRNGWGITPESISTQMRDGVDSIKAGLRELEKFGYLQRTRERRPNGTLGATVYFVTDQPEAVAAFLGGETPSVEPEGDFPPLDTPPQAEPPVDEPPEAEPPVVDPPHKNINSKHTSSAEHSLSRPADPRRTTAPAAPKGEREIKQPTDPAAEAIVTAYTQAIHRPVSSVTRTKLHQQAAQLLADGFPAAWIADRARELAERGWTDLAQHCDRSTVPTTRVPTDSRTGWCGQCTDPIYRTVKRPDGELTECDTCHPAAVARRRRAETGAAA